LNALEYREGSLVIRLDGKRTLETHRLDNCLRAEPKIQLQLPGIECDSDGPYQTDSLRRGSSWEVGALALGQALAPLLKPHSFRFIPKSA